MDGFANRTCGRSTRTTGTLSLYDQIHDRTETAEVLPRPEMPDEASEANRQSEGGVQYHRPDVLLSDPLHRMREADGTALSKSKNVGYPYRWCQATCGSPSDVRPRHTRGHGGWGSCTPGRRSLGGPRQLHLGTRDHAGVSRKL
jgi:hypothetical protein